ncbi:hypothetical protein Tco_0784854 [Tanacetum coccineum]
MHLIPLFNQPQPMSLESIGYAYFIYLEYIDYVFSEDGLLMDTVRRQLWSASKPEVLIHVEEQDAVMSDSEDSTVTYTADEVHPADEAGHYLLLSHPCSSPGYVPRSDPEEDPKEDDEDPEEDPADYPTDKDDDEDPEEDLADYPADGGDDGDDEDESSDDVEDDDVDIEGDKEGEENPAPADSTTVAFPTIEHALSAEETEPFETDESATTPPPHPAYRVTARISIRDKPPTPFWSDTKIPSPPLPPILSPLPVSLPLLVSSPPPPASPIRPLGYRAAMIRLRAEASYISYSLPLPSLLPILAPTSSLPFLLPSTSRRDDRPEVTLPHRKRLGIALSPRYEVEESSSAAARSTRGSRVDYGFIATIDKEIMRDLERDVGYGITDT